MINFDGRRRKLLALGGAAAAAALLPKAAVAQSVGSLNFGYQNTAWGTVGMIAESQHFLKQAGADVTIFRFDGGKTTRDAMIAGRVDIGTIGSTPFVIGATKGELVGVGMAMYAGKTGSVVAGVKSGIKSVADLKGRKVASQLGSSIDATLQNKVLPRFGLSRSDVQIVNIPHQNHIPALAAGSVDAFAGVEPFPSVAEVEKLGVVLVDYSDFDIAPVILAANRSVIEQKRNTVVAFLRGWLAALKLFQNDRAKAADIVFSHFKSQGFDVSRDVVKVMLAKLDVNPDFSPQLTTYLDEEAKSLVVQGKIDAIPDWSKVLEPNLLQGQISKEMGGHNGRHIPA